MPRTKKPAGTAVDRRNGRRADAVAPGKLAPGVKPRRPEGLCPEAVREWDEFWKSSAASAMTAADRGVVLRWIDCTDRYMRLIKEADLSPTVEGSTGQDVPNPLYAIAEKALATVEKAERQLGIGSLNRSALGIAVITEAKSLHDMNARYGSSANDADDEADAEEEGDGEDPRLAVVRGEVV